jgi:hypothetical protein
MPMRKHLPKSLWIIGVAAIFVGAFGFGAPAHAATASQLARAFVLTRKEVGPELTSKSESYTPAQDAAQGTWTLSQLESWGYEAGFERVFDRDLGTSNSEQIASNAGVYRTSAGAAASLEANGNACIAGSLQVLKAPTKLGQESVFCTETGTEAGTTGQLFLLFWRIGRFKGSITLSGIKGHVTAAQTVSLAELQAERMPKG